MQMLTEDEVRANLPAVIDSLRPGEDVVVTRGGKPVARLLADGPPRKAGNCAGMAVIVSDEDADMSDFAEYME